MGIVATRHRRNRFAWQLVYLYKRRMLIKNLILVFRCSVCLFHLRLSSVISSNKFKMPRTCTTGFSSFYKLILLYFVYQEKSLRWFSSRSEKGDCNCKFLCCRYHFRTTSGRNHKHTVFIKSGQLYRYKN